MTETDHHPAAVEKATEALAAARTAQTAADEKREDAAAAAKDVRARVAKGDDKVIGADLTDADQALELAELRSEAAAQRVEEAEAALHQAEIDRLRADVEAVLEGDGVERLSGKLETVAETLVGLIDEWRSQRDTVNELATRSVGLDPLPSEFQRDGGTLKWRNRPVGVPAADALLAALIGHIFDGQGVKVAKDLGDGIRHYTSGYAGSVAHRYPLGAVLHPYGTDRIYELVGKQRWTGDE